MKNLAYDMSTMQPNEYKDETIIKLNICIGNRSNEIYCTTIWCQKNNEKTTVKTLWSVANRLILMVSFSSKHQHSLFR